MRILFMGLVLLNLILLTGCTLNFNVNNKEKAQEPTYKGSCKYDENNNLILKENESCTTKTGILMTKPENRKTE